MPDDDPAGVGAERADRGVPLLGGAEKREVPGGLRILAIGTNKRWEVARQDKGDEAAKLFGEGVLLNRAAKGARAAACTFIDAEGVVSHAKVTTWLGRQSDFLTVSNEASKPNKPPYVAGLL